MTLPQGGCKKYGSVLNLHILIGCDLVALDRFVRIDSISTHALQVECDWLYGIRKKRNFVSTHTLQVECDCSTSISHKNAISFNSHTPSGV